MTSPAALATAFKVHTGFKTQEVLATGLPELDIVIRGFPRGTISEITGPESSGRATLANALLACATGNLEICAYVDASDSFDPQSAAASGVILSQLVWVRCGHDNAHALTAADLLIQAGGFGVVVLDISRVPDRELRRIPISYWHRFRLSVENTPTILALIEREAQARSCAGMILELTRKRAVWTGAPGFHLLKEIEIEAGCRKPVRSTTGTYLARAVG